MSCSASESDATRRASTKSDADSAAADVCGESDATLSQAMELAQLFPDLEFEMLRDLVVHANSVEHAAELAATGPAVAIEFLRKCVEETALRAALDAQGVDMDQLVANAKAANVPPRCAIEMALGQVGAGVAASQFPHLASHLSASALAVLMAAEGGGVAGYRAAATLALRNKVWQCRNKERVYHRYTREQSEAALRRWELPPTVAAQCGLPQEAGYTWLDAIEHRRAAAAREAEASGKPPPGPSELAGWHCMGKLPCFKYLDSRCQHCGSTSGKTTVAPPETEDERNPRFNLEGRVYVLHCDKCGKKSRWWRSQAPEIMLNPNNWGRRCGECADLWAWFAGYLGVGQRYVISVDNDHIWTETWDECTGTFKRGGVHSNGWTDIIAIGSSLPSNGPSHEIASEQVTERYLNQWPGDNSVRERVLTRRMDPTGQKTQLKSVIGYACMQGKLDAAGVTAVLRAAQRDYDAGRALSDLSSSCPDTSMATVEEQVVAQEALVAVVDDPKQAAPLVVEEPVPVSSSSSSRSSSLNQLEPAAVAAA